MHGLSKLARGFKQLPKPGDSPVGGISVYNHIHLVYFIGSIPQRNINVYLVYHRSIFGMFLASSQLALHAQSLDQTVGTLGASSYEAQESLGTLRVSTILGYTSHLHHHSINILELSPGIRLHDYGNNTMFNG